MPSAITQIFWPGHVILEGHEGDFRMGLRAATFDAMRDNGANIPPPFLVHLESPVVDCVGADLRQVYCNAKDPSEFDKVWRAQNTPHLRVVLKYTAGDRYPDTQEFREGVGRAIKDWLDSCEYLVAGISKHVRVEPLYGAVYLD